MLRSLLLPGPDGIGPIVTQMGMEPDGKQVLFRASARNDSGLTIRLAEYCIYPLKRPTLCMMTSPPLNEPWKPGETIKWSETFKNVGHGLPYHTPSHSLRSNQLLSPAQPERSKCNQPERRPHRYCN